MMNIQSSKLPSRVDNLQEKELAKFGVARLRDQVFEAVQNLWRRRKSEGWTQQRVADAIGRDSGWVSRNLRAPGNWTLRTAGEFIQALDGEVVITIDALEDATPSRINYDAYDNYVVLSIDDEKSTVVREADTPIKVTMFSSLQHVGMIVQAPFRAEVYPR